MVKATRAPKNFPIAGLVGNKRELDTLVKTVAIAGYSAVIRRLVRTHFEPCETCHLPVARRDDALASMRPVHEECRTDLVRHPPERRRGARRPRPSSAPAARGRVPRSRFSHVQ